MYMHMKLHVFKFFNDQNGAPVVLDIFRFHGRFKRKQDWRRQMFQIKDGFLKYFKSNPVRLDVQYSKCIPL